MVVDIVVLYKWFIFAISNFLGMHGSLLTTDVGPSTSSSIPPSAPQGHGTFLKDTYATGTIRGNRMGLPMALKTTQAFKKEPQGTIFSQMHNSRRIFCCMWKDKRLVLLISTHAPLVQVPMEISVASVPRRDGAHRPLIPTSPQLLEYIAWMRRVDVVDQLRASYSYQV